MEPFPAPQTPTPLPTQKKKRFSALFLVAILLVGLVAGGLIGFALTYSSLNMRLNTIEGQLGLSGSGTNSPGAVFFLGENVSLSTIYQQVKSSVVVIQDLVPKGSIFGATVYSMQQGSGFITQVNGQTVVVTNNHVIEGAINYTVTFASGDSYPAQVLGSDALADLAVLSVPSMPSGITPLTLASSDTLQVGDPVVAVGTPYGLSGTLTTGIISALGRTIIEDSATNKNGQVIADIIQTSTAINPGNSGGPLVTYQGEVVGITTADISNSQGLGFAIPSDTIIRELPSLVSTGAYTAHPSINAEGTDMNFPIAQAMGITTTYGFLVETVSVNNGFHGGGGQTFILGSYLKLGGDVIIGINGARIANTDDLLSYLEQHTLPGQTVNFTIIRNGQQQTIQVTIGQA
jgi:S1-C subfamily serine protease